MTKNPLDIEIVSISRFVQFKWIGLSLSISIVQDCHIVCVITERCKYWSKILKPAAPAEKNSEELKQRGEMQRRVFKGLTTGAFQVPSNSKRTNFEQMNTKKRVLLKASASYPFKTSLRWWSLTFGVISSESAVFERIYGLTSAPVTYHKVQVRSQEMIIDSIKPS